jgi:hypothetical protein
MLRAPRSLSAAVIAYLLAMPGLSAIALHLSAFVTAQVIALGAPHLIGNTASPRSRVEQRRIDVAEAIPPLPVAKLTASKRPAAPLGMLVAQLDVAETESLPAEAETPALRRAGRAKPRLRRLAARFATPPAADAFNRNFGVLPVASY